MDQTISHDIGTGIDTQNNSVRTHLLKAPFLANIVPVNIPSTRRSYKGMSLLIKTIVLAASILYIIFRLHESSATLDQARLRDALFSGPLLYAALLVPVNWGIEALKWRILIKDLEPLSFGRSYQGVLAGVTVSIFTPNRVGEFAGRVFFLRHADKIQASLLCFAGGFFQLLVTVLAGALAYYILQNKYYNFFAEGLPMEYFLYAGLLVIIPLLAVLWLSGKNNMLREHIGKYFRVLRALPSSLFQSVFWLSLMRYAVFTFQYLLVLQAFGISAGITILICLICLTFFVSTAVPTFAFSEIAVRGASASFFIGTISSDSAGIITSSLVLWVLNLVIPAIAGIYPVWKMKIFSS
jgi:hypothetical protein